MYEDAYEEAQRIIRISDEVRISLERVTSEPEATSPEADKSTEIEVVREKLTTSKLAQKLGLKTAQFMDRAAKQGYLELEGDKHAVTPKGASAGIEFVAKSRFGPYFLWPQDFHPV